MRMHRSDRVVVEVVIPHQPAEPLSSYLNARFTVHTGGWTNRDAVCQELGRLFIPLSRRMHQKIRLGKRERLWVFRERWEQEVLKAARNLLARRRTKPPITLNPNSQHAVVTHNFSVVIAPSRRSSETGPRSP